MPWAIIYCLCFGCSHHQCAHHVHHSPMFMVCKIHFDHDTCGWLGRNHQKTPATNFKEHFGKVAVPCLGECIWNARYPPPCASARFRICGMGFIGILLPSNVSKFICNLVVHSTKPPTTCDRVVDSVDSSAALLNQRGEQSNVWVLCGLWCILTRSGARPLRCNDGQKVFTGRAQKNDGVRGAAASQSVSANRVWEAPTYLSLRQLSPRQGCIKLHAFRKDWQHYIGLNPFRHR